MHFWDRLLFICSLIFLGSCGSDPELPKTLRFEGVWSPEDRAVLAAVVQEWNKYAIPSRELSFSDSGVWKLYRQDPCKIDPRTCDIDYLGFTSGQGHWVAIKPFDNPNGLFRAISLHELGHVLGLRHIPTGVMRPVIKVADPDFDYSVIRITPEDLEECRSVGSC